MKTYRVVRVAVNINGSERQYCSKSCKYLNKRNEARPYCDLYRKHLATLWGYSHRCLTCIQGDS